MTLPRDPHLVVRPLLPGRYDEALDLELGGGGVGPSRHGGRTPAPAQAPGLLWDGVLVQWGIHEPDTDHLIGLVTCYDADLRNQHAWIAAWSRPVTSGSGLVLLGLGLLISDLFARWPFRQLFAETDREAYQRFATGTDRSFRIDGVLEGHRLRDGQPADRLLIAIERSAWTTGHGADLGHRAHLAPIATITRRHDP